jgi:hypothetical protein
VFEQRQYADGGADFSATGTHDGSNVGRATVTGTLLQSEAGLVEVSRRLPVLVAAGAH